MATRLYGTVKYFNLFKGFGFIKQENGREDLFTHADCIAGDGLKVLNVGERVSYIIRRNKKGDRAVEVKREVVPEVVNEDNWHDFLGKIIDKDKF